MTFFFFEIILSNDFPILIFIFNFSVKNWAGSVRAKRGSCGPSIRDVYINSSLQSLSSSSKAKRGLHYQNQRKRKETLEKAIEAARREEGAGHQEERTRAFPEERFNVSSLKFILSCSFFTDRFSRSAWLALWPFRSDSQLKFRLFGGSGNQLIQGGVSASNPRDLWPGVGEILARRRDLVALRAIGRSGS